MEKILFPTLSSILEQRQHFTLEEFLRFALAAVATLEDIHRFDIIHKDINEYNVLYCQEQNLCKIVDFGLSIAINHQKVIPVNPEYLEGTLAYISPEQSGRMNRGIDYRTDYYSLGVLFYRALTGKLPFVSSDPFELVYMHIAILPRPPSRIDPLIPEVVSNLILKLLSKEPEGRYQSIVGIRSDLTACLEGLIDGQIAPFLLGSRDTFERFQTPEKIYGREEELERLLFQYEAVTGGRSSLVLIGGYSGVGKTSLVHELYKPIADKQGDIISGKFDQFRHNIPYLAFSQAFDEFIKARLRESEKELALFRKRVLEAVGNNGQIVIDAVSSLQLVIGKQPPVQEAGLEETQNRFAYTFQRFVQCLPTPEHPLVLFLDDLQWADMPSFRLLESLLQAECPYLLIIGGYRDNEVDEKHPLTQLMRRLEKQAISYETLSLAPLKFSDVQEFIADTFFSSLEEVVPLAEICFTKTAGNPFFLIQLLESLYQRDEIRYDWKRAHWGWDIEKISKAQIGDNIVTLMIDKIRSLEPDLQALLATAACIGNRFSITILEKILEQSAEQLRPLLESLLRREFLTYQEKHYYSAEHFQFAHDRIQQAAHELLDAKKRVNLHIAVAEHLLKTTLSDRIKEVLFTIVNHYNRAVDEDLVPAALEGQRKQIATLNFTAATNAKEAAAYEIALKYCQASLKWLQGGKWDQEYAFLMELCSEAMECAYLSDKVDLMEYYGTLIATHSKGVLDECRAIKTRGLYCISKGNLEGALAIFLEAAKQLGFSFPKKPTTRHVLLGLVKTLFGRIVTGRSIEELVDLPPINNRFAEAYIDLLYVFTPPLYIKGKELYPLGFFKAVQLLFLYGNSKIAPIAYVNFGTILISVGAIESGYSFGKLSLLLTEHFDDPQGRITTIVMTGLLTTHWKEPLQEVASLLMNNYFTGLETGNKLYAALSLWVGFVYSFHAGVFLPELVEKVGESIKPMSELKYQAAIDGLPVLREAMMKLTASGSSSSGEEKKSEPPDETGKGLLYSYQLMTGWILRDFTAAEEAINKFPKYAVSLTGHYAITLFYFYKTLTLTAQLSEASLMKRIGMRRSIWQGIKRLKKYAKHGPSNQFHKYLLLLAEWARVNDRVTEAEGFYEKAIHHAMKEKFIHEEAVANELAGRFYLAEKRPQHAILFIKEALNCYKKWGAFNKVEQLKGEFEELLQGQVEVKKEVVTETKSMEMGSVSTANEKMATGGRTQTFKIDASAIDTGAVQKAAETIASTILMDELLKKLMDIAMEYAGAERGLLLMARREGFFIEAESDKRSGETRLLHSLEIRPDYLSVSILQMVIHSKEVLLVRDAIRERRAEEDPYIRATRVKSILCIPLINKEKITAILYLENNLAKNAFTAERCNLLSLLSSQLAMSIDNAKLYEGTIQLNLSYERFVPKDFLSLLGKKQITEVELGDHQQRDMNILFMDIRGFTTLSEKMTPTENFAFINEFLGHMEPIIRQHNGFIDKYIGDAIMALFSGSADNALSCAIEMVKGLEKYNKQRGATGEPPIRIGIGINSGPLILGTVGNDKRMDGTVISDAVNVASRVEHLTKDYGLSILITENARQQLKDPTRYLLRKVAETEIRGKKEKMLLYGLSEY